MKKTRLNLKRLSMTLGVLGTTAGLLAAAALYKAPLAAYAPSGDPALVGTPDEFAAVGQGGWAAQPGEGFSGGPQAQAPQPDAPLEGAEIAAVTETAEAAMPNDSGDPLGPKAGKYGPTAMVLGAEVRGTGDRLSDMLPPEPANPQKAQPGADIALEAGADRPAVEAQAASVEAEATRQPLVLVSAMDQPPAGPAVASRRHAATASAGGWRATQSAWMAGRRGLKAAKPPFTSPVTGPLPKVGEVRFDSQAGMLVIPVTGNLPATRVVMHRLPDGRAYVDLIGAEMAFSGKRTADVLGPISRWVMASHSPATATNGHPGARVAFKLANAAVPTLEVVPGAVRVRFTDGKAQQELAAARAAAIALATEKVSGRASAPATSKAEVVVNDAASSEATGSPRLAEARYDMASGVLAIPVTGNVNPASLQLKYLGDGRAYLDVAGARPAFSGSRSANYPGHALTRWAMADHSTAGQAVTRVAFSLNPAAKAVSTVDVRVVAGEIRLMLPGHGGAQPRAVAPAAAVKESLPAPIRVVAPKAAPVSAPRLTHPVANPDNETPPSETIRSDRTEEEALENDSRD